MKPSEILRKAKELLETKKWTQAYVALDGYARYCSPCSTKAECFCSMGAIGHVVGSDDPLLGHGAHVSPAERLMDAVFPEWRDGANGDNAVDLVVDWNDDKQQTKQEIIDTFALAIELAEREGQ
jgi:hypothetical protein